jgi:hypothetical protein
MRIGRAIAIPAIVILAAAGSSLAASVTPAAAVHMDTVHVLASAPASTVSGTYYHS